MINALLGIKKNMTSTYDARGRRVGATMVEITPNFVTQIKTAETKDGYSAVQLGIGSKKSVLKPQIGHFKKAGIEQKLQYVKEVRASEISENPGQSINVWDIFSKGDAVKVTAISKGKGFQGGVRRHGFHGRPKTHGQSDRHRAPGSIGAGTTPGGVYKGKSMAGHMGSETASTINLEVINIDRQNNLMTIKGGIPGPTGSLVTITKLGRIKGYTPPPEEKEDEEEAVAEGVENNEVPAEAPVETKAVAKAEEAQDLRPLDAGQSKASTDESLDSEASTEAKPEESQVS